MLSIIVPCYNEEKALPLFYQEATSVFQKIKREYEFVFINDGSKDHTLSIMQELAEKDSHVVYVSFSRNFGKEAAMYAGFCNARGTYIAVMDADLQDPPSLIPQMLDILENGDYDSVASRRVDRKGEPPVRSWFAKKFYQVINKISDADCRWCQGFSIDEERDGRCNYFYGRV